MAICTLCNNEMTGSVSCVPHPVELIDGIYERVRYGAECTPWKTSDSCGDCGVRKGGFHHLGCDLEECPYCHRQLISCGCMVDEDDEWDDVEYDGDDYEEEEAR